MTVYEVVGGRDFFVDLVERFYDRVAGDDLLMAMYPEDLTESRRTTTGFLAQYWGGPPDYSAERGHPRLRMRHARFPIGGTARDRWLQHMLVALAETTDARDTPDDVREQMAQYFAHASRAMINQAE